MSNIAKVLILVLVVMGIGVGLVVWKNKVGGHDAGGDLNSISKSEMELLLKDAPPTALKRLADDPELKKQQVDNLKQLLALASQARKDGVANEEYVKNELENIKDEITAVSYDREINKDKGQMPPFGFITEEQTKAFWDEGTHDAEFQSFLDGKIRLLKETNPQMKDREISDEEKTQAKDFFAKIAIYDKEYEEKLKAGQLPEDFQEKVNLQVKLQQASFLAKMYAKTLAEKTKVTDEDIDKYIAAHPELDSKEKKAKAEEILNRAKNGEDFAKLANEFSTDPGNKNPKGDLQGGLYANVQKGRMMPEFESAALALSPGQIAPNLVETPYGYHIIKLEKKGETKDPQGQTTETYDVRHILIGTSVKDPENPMGREMPVKDFVRAKLETDKQKQVLDEIVANNNVQVAEDFVVPQPSEEEMKQMMEKQMPMMPQGAEDAPPTAPNGKMPPPRPGAPNGKTPQSKPAPPEKK